MKLSGRFEFTRKEIAAVLGVNVSSVTRRAAAEAWPYAETTVQGGRQRLYPMDRLPEALQLAIVAVQRREQEREAAARAAADTKLQARIKAQWRAYGEAKGWRKEQADARHDALLEVERVRREEGVSLTEARKRVAARARDAGIDGRSVETLKRLAKMVKGIPRQYVVAFLLPDEKGAPPLAYIHPVAWASFYKDWMRPEKPAAEACYRRLERRAQNYQEWLPLPSLDTFMRRIKEIPEAKRRYAREGDRGLAELAPPIVRDYSALAALEIVNADGHLCDLRVKFPDGEIGRPVIVAWQDVHSKKILSWRADRSEHAELARLAFLDMVEKYGIPQVAMMDNGRAFASKSVSGGAPTRYRFKVKPEDPQGILTRLAVETIWTKPANGRAKPIERAWRDFAEEGARGPAARGAYTGNSPTNKPANYGSRVLEWEEFKSLAAYVFAEFNARTDRERATLPHANGRSYDAVFAESYAASAPKRATAEQLALLRLPGVQVKVCRRRGHVRFAGNFYWHEKTADRAGQTVELRFDPDALHDGVHVFEPDGTYVVKAECITPIGYRDQASAREAVRRQKDYEKKQRAAVKADEARFADAPSDLPPIPEPTLPSPAVITMFQPPRKPVAAVEAGTPDDDQGDAERAVFWIEQAKKRNAL